MLLSRVSLWLIQIASTQKVLLKSGLRMCSKASNRFFVTLRKADCCCGFSNVADTQGSIHILPGFSVVPQVYERASNGYLSGLSRSIVEIRM